MWHISPLSWSLFWFLQEFKWYLHYSHHTMYTAEFRLNFGYLFNMPTFFHFWVFDEKFNEFCVFILRLYKLNIFWYVIYYSLFVCISVNKWIKCYVNNIMAVTHVFKIISKEFSHTFHIPRYMIPRWLFRDVTQIVLI